MGFTIKAMNMSDKTIAEIDAYMGAFRMCNEQGYNWFELLEASGANGGVSGSGETLFIKKSNLVFAMETLRRHDTQGKLTSDGRDEWTHRKPILQEFMQECIDWCEMEQKDGINIYFG